MPFYFRVNLVLIYSVLIFIANVSTLFKKIFFILKQRKKRRYVNMDFSLFNSWVYCGCLELHSNRNCLTSHLYLPSIYSSKGSWLLQVFFIKARIFTGRTDAEAPILWPPDVKSWLIGKDPDDGKDGRRRRGQQRMRWLDGITNSMDLILSKF